MRWIFLGIILFLICLMLFLPLFFSTDVGTRWLVIGMNSQIQGKVEIGKLDLSWRGPQRAEKIVLKNKAGNEILAIDLLESHTSLFTLLFNRNTYGTTTIKQLDMLLERDEKGVSNLEKSLSKNPRKSHFPNFRGKLTLIDGDVILKSPKIDAVEITDIDLEYFPKEKLFHIHAFTKERSVKGEILASGSLGEKGHILAEIENFPITILDQIQNTQLYTQAFGEQMDLKIETKREQESIYVSADVKSKNLEGLIEGEIRDKLFMLDPRSHLSLEITPGLFHALISPDLKEQWSLEGKTTLTFDIREGEIPLTLDWKEMSLYAAAHLERTELLHKTQGHYSLNDVEGLFVTKENSNLKVTGEIVGKETARFVAEFEFNDGIKFGICSDGFPFSLLELAFEETAALAYFFGDTIELQINGEYSSEKGLFSTIDIKSLSTQVNGTLEGEKLNKLNFSLSGERKLFGGLKKTLGEEISFAFTGNGAIIDRSFSVKEFKGQIQNAILVTDIEGDFGKKGAPFAFHQIQVKGSGKLLKLPENEALINAKLNEGTFSFEVDGKKNLLTSKLRTTFSILDGENRVDAKHVKAELKVQDFFQNSHIDYKNASITFEGDLEHFPTSIFSAWLPEHIHLSDLIGPTVNLITKVNYTPSETAIDIDASSPGFNTDLSLSIGPNFNIRQKEKGHIHWEMSPGRYKALVSILSNEETTYELRSSPALDIEIEKIHCPEEFPSSVKVMLCRSGISGKVKVGPMLFMNPKTKDKFTLSNIRGGILGENFSRKMHIDLDGDVFSPLTPKAEAPYFSIDIDIINAWNENLALSGEANLYLLPVKQLLGIIPLNPVFRTKTEAVFGEIINARMTAQIVDMQGPITIDVSASNFKGTFPLQLSQTQVLLRDYLRAEIYLTDEVSQNFLIDINPLLIQGARSDHPIRLYIAPEGFSFPIPWSFPALTIEKAVVDIGKIYVQNGGAVEELMKFLKSKPPKDRMMRAWFTPVFLSLKNGVLQHERFDMLLHKKVHIALWGRVDLIKSKVWMTLGIAPQTLKQRFNILGVTKKDMFQVKMRGYTDNVELDWSSAYTRIGILIARLAGGPPGYIVGGLLEQIISVLGEEPTPPPTTYPFPWDEKQLQEESEMIPEITRPPPDSAKQGRRKLFEFLIP